MNHHTVPAPAGLSSTLDPELDVYTFDVFTSPHDDVKQGILARRWSRVIVSREEFPTCAAAADAAACLAVAIHGGMPTSVLARF